MACLVTLRMLVLVSATALAAAALPTDCSGGQCEADSSVLFQQQVRIAEADRPIMHDELQDVSRRPVQALQAEVEGMVRDFKADSTKRPQIKKINSIKHMVANEIMPELKFTHDEAQKDLNTYSAAVSTCNRNATRELNVMKTKVEVQVAGARSDHSTCRTAEAPLNATKVKRCTELSTFSTAITLPAVLPSKRTPEMMGPYLSAMSTYFCPKHDIFMKLDKACTEATTNYTTHRTECNKKQDRYELDFCTWKTKLTDACASSSTCYATAVKSYVTKEIATKVLEAKWKTEYVGLTKILCYLDVWMHNGDTKTVSQKGLNSCNGSAVDTTPMHINYPGVPCAITCDTTPVQNFPGTEGFLASFRNLKQKVDKVTPCLKDRTPLPKPGPKPSPKPIMSPMTSKPGGPLGLMEDSESGNEDEVHADEIEQDEETQKALDEGAMVDEAEQNLQQSLESSDYVDLQKPATCFHESYSIKGTR